MSNYDYKKEFKNLYQPKTIPHLIEVPAMKFFYVDGRGDPNEQDGAYQEALQILYALSYTVKMSPKAKHDIDGYFAYVVPPLEGLWWQEDDTITLSNCTQDKTKFCWRSMIRQPEFVNEEVFTWACEQVQKKKGLPIEKAGFMIYEEGLCVQMMHKGSYDKEPASFAQMDAFLLEQNLIPIEKQLEDGRSVHMHHEVYLSDPRKGKPENMRTILRMQVKKA